MLTWLTEIVTNRKYLKCHNAQILLKKGISQGEIGSILKKIGIEYDTWAIAKVIIGNDLKTNKVFLRLK